MVIYTSDHGDMNNSHSLYSKGPAMYEEITSIPFIVRWGDKIGSSKVCNHPVSHISVVPTVLELFGVDIPKTIDGKSILPTLKGEPEPAGDIFIEFNRFCVTHEGKERDFCPIRSCRDKRYKLVINMLSTDELYDLDNDRAEMKNLIYSPDHIIIRNELHDKIINWMTKTRDPLRGDVWKSRPWRDDLEQSNNYIHNSVREEKNDPVRLEYITGLPKEEH